MLSLFLIQEEFLLFEVCDTYFMCFLRFLCVFWGCFTLKLCNVFVDLLKLRNPEVILGLRLIIGHTDGELY